MIIWVMSIWVKDSELVFEEGGILIVLGGGWLNYKNGKSLVMRRRVDERGGCIVDYVSFFGVMIFLEIGGGEEKEEEGIVRLISVFRQ